jgi:hypothetical protein
LLGDTKKKEFLCPSDLCHSIGARLIRLKSRTLFKGYIVATQEKLNGEGLKILLKEKSMKGTDV